MFEGIEYINVDKCIILEGPLDPKLYPKMA